MKELIKIQSELKAPKNQFNKFGNYNYRSCEDILEALKPLLLKHECNLVITDEVKTVGSLVYVEAKATISKGDQIVSVTAQAGINPDRKGMDIAQSFGASSSYARKYSLNGLFLIDDTKDPDATNDHGKKESSYQKATEAFEKPSLPWLNENTTDWKKVVEALKTGYTIAQVKTRFRLSKENEQKLIEQSK